MGEALIFLETVEFLFVYVKLEVKEHSIETGNWKYRTIVLHSTQKNFQES